MTEPSAEMIAANRQDTQREAALGRILTAMQEAKQLYGDQWQFTLRLVKAEKLIEHERNFLQAVWD